MGPTPFSTRIRSFSWQGPAASKPGNPAGFDHRPQRSVHRQQEPRVKRPSQAGCSFWPLGQWQEQAAGARSRCWGASIFRGPNRRKARASGHDHPILNRCGQGERSRNLEASLILPARPAAAWTVGVPGALSPAAGLQPWPGRPECWRVRGLSLQEPASMNRSAPSSHSG